MAENPNPEPVKQADRPRPLISESVKRPASPPAPGPDDAPKRSAEAVEEQQAHRLPNAEELEKARQAHFGDDTTGTVTIDADPDGTRDRRVEIVLVDKHGDEVSREPFKPAGKPKGE